MSAKQCLISPFLNSFVIFISGLSCSGKTELGKNISRDFSLPYINQQTYYKKDVEKYILPNKVEILNYDQDSAIDWEKFNSDINEKINEKQGLEDSMAQMQTQMMLIMPLMIAFFSYGFPVGLSLYWNTFTVIGIIQQYIIAGPGALGKYLPKQWQKQN